MLAEAVASALLQGAAEVLVLHDRMEQHLVSADARVRIENRPRYPSIGQKRNDALALATQPFVTWLDDDDLLAPGYVAALHQAMGTSYVAVLSRRGWWFDGTEPSPAATPLIAGMARREAALAAAFPASDFGEDAEHRTALSRLGPVRHIQEPVGYVYRWATGAPHASWSHLDGRARVETDVAKRLQVGYEPRGQVRLQPKLGPKWAGWLDRIGREAHGTTPT